MPRMFPVIGRSRRTSRTTRNVSFSSCGKWKVGLLGVGVLINLVLWFPNLPGFDVLLLDSKAVSAAYDPFRVCSQNPYLPAIPEPLKDIASKMDAWLSPEGLHQQYEKASEAVMKEHTHMRFFPFEASMASCAARDCIGGPCREDESKIVCGLTHLQQKEQQQQPNGARKQRRRRLQDLPETKDGNQQQKCIIYSIGSNNQWRFENEALLKTSCDIHTFDCTGQASRFRKPPSDRLFFHHVCLGAEQEDADPSPDCAKCGETWTLLEIQQRLGHERIDLLKMDIEGFEWPLFESWPTLDDSAATEIFMPMQILVEIHYYTLFQQLHQPDLFGSTEEFRSPKDMVDLQARFLRMGYVVVVRDDNGYCQHCTELTLVRVRCPGSGVYHIGAI